MVNFVHSVEVENKNLTHFTVHPVVLVNPCKILVYPGMYNTSG